MLNFKREVLEVSGKRVLVTSWLDKDKKFWRALAPRFLGIIHDWRGVQGETKEQAVDGLKALIEELVVPHDKQNAKRESKNKNTTYV